MWMSGDATLETIAGISWADKGYFVFDAPPLIWLFKRNEKEDVIIGECELLVTLIIALLWGIRNNESRILIICTDNLNVFEWLKSWKAKSGCANRMLQALIDFLIEKGIEIVPRYVRSGHNFPCDHLSRTDDKGIKEWSYRMNMTKRNLPHEWGDFCAKRQVGKCEDLPVRVDYKSTLRSFSRRLPACEWRPACYTFVALCQRLGIQISKHEPDHPALETQVKDVLRWNQHHVDILVGMVWTDTELIDFSHGVGQICPGAAVAIAPHAFRDPPPLVVPWKECVFVDSSMYGSVHNQVWRLYIWGQLGSANLLCTPAYRPTYLLADAYRDAGMTAQKDELGFTRVIPFDRVAGLAVLLETVEGQQYSSPTQIPQLSMAEIWIGDPRWPKNEQREEEPSNREKIVILG